MHNADTGKDAFTSESSIYIFTKQATYTVKVIQDVTVQAWIHFYK